MRHFFCRLFHAASLHAPQQAALDKKYINSKHLRQARLDALKQLQERADLLGIEASAVGVPDGPAMESGAITNGDDDEETEGGYTLQRLYRGCYVCKAR